uniref:Uncharacterized protein n=1 Tax=Rhizophora mucronata TaxID=61149 RepID=A0A2P2Q670_RHIMU
MWDWFPVNNLSHSSTCHFLCHPAD